MQPSPWTVSSTSGQRPGRALEHHRSLTPLARKGAAHRHWAAPSRVRSTGGHGGPRDGRRGHRDDPHGGHFDGPFRGRPTRTSRSPCHSDRSDLSLVRTRNHVRGQQDLQWRPSGGRMKGVVPPNGTAVAFAARVRRLFEASTRAPTRATCPTEGRRPAARRRSRRRVAMRGRPRSGPARSAARGCGTSTSPSTRAAVRPGCSAPSHGRASTGDRPAEGRASLPCRARRTG